MTKNKDKDAKTESAVAVKAGGQVVPFDYGDHKGQGFENQSGADIVLPFISLLQSNSPQVENPVGEGGIEGARSGMLINSLTETLWDGKEGVEFIPAITEHQYVEWIKRTAGGGFVGRHDPGSTVVENAKANGTPINELETEAGNDLVETFYVYGVIVDDGTPMPVVLAFNSTKIKIYKKWNTKLLLFGQKAQIPLMAHLTRLGSSQERNTKGAFANYTLTPAGGGLIDSLLDPSDERFVAAASVREMILEGSARASFETQQGSSGAGGATGGDGGEVPF